MPNPTNSTIAYPDLQIWVARYGGYDQIPWQQWDAAVLAWRRAYEDRIFAENYQARLKARQAQANERTDKMNIDDYITKGGFITSDTVASGPIRDTIADCKMGRFERLDLHLHGGGTLGLNQTNLRTLRSAWGSESDAWIGKEIELSLGQTKWQGEDRPTVVLRTISPSTAWNKQPAGQKPLTRPPAKSQQDFDDNIPFS